MKQLINTILAALLFLICAIGGATNVHEPIGYPVCPGPQCGNGED